MKHIIDVDGDATPTEVAEYDGSDVLAAYTVFGNYIDETLFRVAYDGPAFVGAFVYAHDPLYSTAAMVNFDAADAADIVERYEYDAYGEVTILNAEFSILNASQYANPTTFTGRRLDTLDDGSLSIMYYRHRDYSPQRGRFMTHDPKWIVPLVKRQTFFYPYGQLLINRNLYEYVNSLPVKMLDPMGLEEWDKEACEKEVQDELDDCLEQGEKLLDRCIEMVSDALDTCINDCKSLPVGLKHGCMLLCGTGGGYAATACIFAAGGWDTGCWVKAGFQSQACQYPPCPPRK